MSSIKEINEKIAEKAADGYKKIEESVVEGYKKISDGVVEGYKKIEKGAVDGFNKVNDKMIEKLFAQDGASVEDAKKRLSGNNEDNKLIEKEKVNHR